MDLQKAYIRGIQVNYYFICKTKLWLFSHNVTMEQESDVVKLGSLLHKEVFTREEKDVQIGPIAMDVVMTSEGVEIREVKKTDKMEKAHVYQTLYYLYFLKELGINAKASISYPKQKKVVRIELNKDKEREIEKVLKEIEIIIREEMPKPVYRKVCRKCAYYELCFC